MKGNKINADDVEPLYKIIRKDDGMPVRLIDFKDMDEMEGYFASSYFLAGAVLGKWTGPEQFDVIELATGKMVEKPKFLRRACIQNECGTVVNSFDEMVQHRLVSAHSSPYIRYPVNITKLEGPRI